MTSDMATVVLRIDDHPDFSEEKQTENRERQASTAVLCRNGQAARPESAAASGHFRRSGFPSTQSICELKPGRRRPTVAWLRFSMPAYGIRKVCPTKIKLGFTKLLSEMIAHGVTWNLAAMDQTVSPGSTTYVRVQGGTGGTPVGMIST